MPFTGAQLLLYVRVSVICGLAIILTVHKAKKDVFY